MDYIMGQINATFFPGGPRNASRKKMENSGGQNCAGNVQESAGHSYNQSSSLHKPHSDAKDFFEMALVLRNRLGSDRPLSVALDEPDTQGPRDRRLWRAGMTTNSATEMSGKEKKSSHVLHQITLHHTIPYAFPSDYSTNASRGKEASYTLRHASPILPAL